eukprot:c28715_g1_i3 orf=691-1884(-)
MPGMRFACTEGQTPSFALVSCLNSDYSLDVLACINPVQFRTAERGPLLPSRHKACRPSQAQGQWLLTSKEAPEVKPFGLHCSVVGSESEHDGGDSENDLADMVHDFIENGCCKQHACDTSDSDLGGSFVTKLCERLESIVADTAVTEKEIASILTTLILVVNESELFCQFDKTGCKGACIRRLAVKHLRMSGYNASICISKWQNTGKVPGGEHEYIDVTIQGDRIFIDLDFRSQFEIARPTEHYQVGLESLPHVFVGKPATLERVLHIMSEAAKCSLKQNSMYLPPWRTFEYMRAKWFSLFERKGIDGSRIEHNIQYIKGVSLQDYSHTPCVPESFQCREQLKRLRAALKADDANGIVLKPITSSGGDMHLAREEDKSCRKGVHHNMQPFSLQCVIP